MSNQPAVQSQSQSRHWGFGWGAGVGMVLALVGLLMTEPDRAVLAADALGSNVSLGIPGWITTNLGHSVWLFSGVLVLYVMNLHRLQKLLGDDADLREISELDQLSDVWIHLFVGIGVIWTAVGMRSALQTALGDPGAALTDSADSVLQKLVDGGILLALTTTIVGGVGGYLMRLIKTMTVGAPLHLYYEEAQRKDMAMVSENTSNIAANVADASASVTQLLAAVDRIDAHLAHLNHPPTALGNHGPSSRSA